MEPEEMAKNVDACYKVRATERQRVNGENETKAHLTSHGKRLFIFFLSRALYFVEKRACPDGSLLIKQLGSATLREHAYNASVCVVQSRSLGTCKTAGVYESPLAHKRKMIF